MSSVITEKSEQRPAPPFRGWLLYDSACRFCRAIAAWLAPIAGRRGFALAPLQADWVRRRLRRPEAELLGEMRLLRPDGTHTGGVAAFLELARQVWWARPLAAAARVPLIRRALDAAYRCFAARRYCVAGRCALPAGPHRVETVERSRV
jgi:predicted DCC family thiol-disulfide oxidoreductase YuxK